MNIHSLNRFFWDFAFEHTGKIKPIHVAIYSFAVEHCNRLGWKEQFGLPTSMVLEAISVKSYSVYKTAFDELVEFGIFEVVQYSKNQYSSNIIALKENYKANYKANEKANEKANYKALDKALSKHITKQVPSQCQSNSESNMSIDIQYTNKQINNNTIELDVYPTFEDFWTAYDKKIERPKTEIKWNKISQADKEKIMNYLPDYVESTPEKKYRKNPLTFLNNQSWTNEIIRNNTETSDISAIGQQQAIMFLNNK